MKNKKIIKFGLLGLGTIVKLRIVKLFKKELKNSKVTAVFDKDLKKTNDYCKKFNCKINKSEKEFFLRDFDFCYISTPSGSHFQDILKCFRYGKSVIVEKPPVLKVSQLTELNKIAKSKNLDFFVIYQNRENKAVKFVKKYLMNNRKKEKIVYVNLNLLWSRPQKYYSRWHGKWKDDGGVLAQQGIHYVDLLCYLFGKPIQAISVIENISNKLEAEDTHIGIVKFKGVNCILGLTTALRPNDLKASIEIYTQSKIINIYGKACNKVSIVNYDKKENKLNKLCKKNSQNFLNGIGTSHYTCFKKIEEKVRNKNQRPLKAIDTIDTLKLVNMLYLSSFKKKWIVNSKNLSSRLGN